MILLLASSPAESILIYIFIGIFVVTAFLTLASLPNWVKLDEWYRKKLFVALILEVVGIIVIVGRGIFLPGGDTKSYEFPQQTPWIALSEYGEVVRPEVKVTERNTDSTYTIRISEDRLQRTPELKLKLNFEQSSELNLLVKSENDITLGKVSNATLYEAGLFNLIQDVSSPNHYANIRWERTDGKWARVDKTINKTLYSEFMDNEVVFEVYDSPAGTKYLLHNRADTVYYSGTREIDFKNRIIHFCKNSRNIYYLFRITSANLQEEPQFVNILQIRLEPNIELGKRQ